MHYKIDGEKLTESLTSLKSYLNSLKRMRVVESWDEVFQTLFHEDHQIAFQCSFDNHDMIKVATHRLVDLLLCAPGCANKETVIRVVEAYCLFRYASQERRGWREDNEASLGLFKDVLLDGKIFNLLSGFKEYVQSQFQRSDLWFMRAVATYGLAIPVFMDQRMFTSMCLSCRPLEKSRFKWVNEKYLILLYETLRRDHGSMKGQGFGRIFGIVQALYATSLALRGFVSQAEKHVHFLETYWDTLPDPLVSEEEIREFLLIAQSEYRPVEILANVRFPGSEKPAIDVDRVIDAFVNLFGRRSYEPRRLSHLCRCSVRGAIVLNSPLTLPASVESLHLPEIIESFILCNPRWRS